MPVAPGQPEPKPAVVTSVTVKRVAFEPAPLEKPIQPGGEWFVQLAAYKHTRWMEPGWVHLTDNFKRLAQYAPSHSVYTVRSEEHTSELQSLMRISYAVFCLKKKKHTKQ